MSSKETLSLFERLNAPFPYQEYSVNYDGFVSVSPQATSDRLNEVFGPEGWKLEVAEQIVDMQLFSVSIALQCLHLRHNLNSGRPRRMDRESTVR